MKKVLKYLIITLVFLPFINVYAGELNCYGSILDVSKDVSFNCDKTVCENLTYIDSSNSSINYKNYFNCTQDDNKIRIEINKDIKFDSSVEVGHVIISDGTNSSNISIKNQAYVKTTTTTTTTTSAGKTITITLDPNNGEKTETKTCNITGTNETCAITLPTRSDKTFTGSGKAKTCTTGNTGSIKANADMTYYACYSEKTNTSLFLNSLKLTYNDKIIDIGTFSKKKFEYDAKVLYDVESIIVDASVDEGISLTTEGNEQLNVGENIINILLSKEDGTSNKYTIKVTRLKKGETLNSINYLKSLVIGGNYNINFDKDVFNYNLKIDNDIKELLITAEALDDTIEPVITGNKELKNGSVINISLKNDSGKETVYKINIIKENKTTLILFAAAAIIIFLILLLVIMIIIKSNKKNKENINHNSEKKSKKKQNEEIEILDI